MGMWRMVIVLVFFGGFLTQSLAVRADGSAQSSQPLEPSAALTTFQLLDGLEIELVAAEPEVIDPIAIRFDEQGRMWVVEMTDYPHGPREGEAPLSRIRILEDRDGDEYFETASVFADQLLFPTGLQPWRGGVIVTLAGEVRYLKDTTGDGKADLSESWFAGFAEENTQLRANHPTLGIDNQIYIANGLRGGEVQRVGDSESPTVSIRSMDFRFDPKTKDFEAVSGFGQFGLTFDDFGNRFVCSNRNPLRHIVLEDRYIQRNPRVAVSETVHDVAAHGENSRIFPRSRAWTTSTLHAGQFTAACGVFLYRGTQLPALYHGAGFTCDPTGNLVHCELLRPAGATFHGTPVAEGTEFLTSSDEWFRPVSLQLGPDGGLYVVDMYRAVIEHPQFMPEELKLRPDLRYGDNRGRIYRVRSKQPPKAPEPRNLADLSSPELVGLLNVENAWQRETAHRLLLERGPASVTELLRTMARENPFPPARAHSLWLLDAADAIEREDLLAALQDLAAPVRQQGLILAEHWLLQRKDSVEDADKVVHLRRTMLERAGDEDARVRFQAALSLTPLQDASEVDALATMATANRTDVWSRRAVALAAGNLSPQVALAVLQRLVAAEEGTRNKGIPDDEVLAAEPLLEELFSAAAMLEGSEQILLSGLLDSEARFSVRLSQAAQRGLLRSWNRRRIAWEPMIADAAESRQWEVWLDDAKRQANDDELPLAARRDAVELLALGRRGDAVIELALRDGIERSIRTLAISRVAPFADRDVWQSLLEQFPGSSPPLRNAIVGAVLPQPNAVELLLNELESGRIKPQELGRLEANRLLQHGQPEIKKRAAEIFASATPAERKAALQKYQAALDLSADAQRGRAVFAKNCASCHRIDDLGVDVAPDIADSRVKTPQQLLTDVLQPNLAIDGNYIGYVVQTEDGRTLTGILTGETASGVTLKLPEGESLTLQRDEIDLIRSTGVSLMPEGLEQNISIQEMADLILFIKNWRYLDGRTPLSE
jgi:putative membrane-bound dehydrogenase-like protein